MADPADACEPLRNRVPSVTALLLSDKDAGQEDGGVQWPGGKLPEAWVALIVRSGGEGLRSCPFDFKVRMAQDAGAVAAIVYDSIDGPLLIMTKLEGAEDPGIPSVFVRRTAGLQMRNIAAKIDSTVLIFPVSETLIRPIKPPPPKKKHTHTLLPFLPPSLSGY